MAGFLAWIDQSGSVGTKPHRISTHLESIISRFVAEIAFVFGIEYPTLTIPLKENISDQHAIWIFFAMGVIP